jgi:hypothetical protein
MLQGFVWTGAIANFVTPAMYIGTPLQASMGTLGYDTSMGPTNYTECVRSETDAAFGSGGVMIEATTEDELRNMAKYCATEFYGVYFAGKAYTTREEMLMFIFTMFEEGVDMAGYFDNNRFVFDGAETKTPYTNVSPRAWFAPYLAAAHNLDMIPSYDTWTVAAKVSDTEIIDMFSAYTSTDTTIATTYGTYTVRGSDTSLTIAKR